MLKVEDFGELSPSTFKKFVEKIKVNDYHLPTQVMARFQSNSFDIRNQNEFIVFEDGMAYKLNKSIGSNKLRGNKVYLSSYYLQVFVSFIIAYIFIHKLDYNVDTFVLPIGAKVENKKGYSWYEIANKGCLESYIKTIHDPNYLDDILIRSIYEISDTLENLRAYRFTHNDLKVENVSVHIEEDEGEPDIRFRIGNFNNSYIEFNGLSIGVNEPLFELMSPEIELEYIDDEYYRIKSIINTKNGIDGFHFRNQREKMIFIDIYTYILSLIFHPNVIKYLPDLPKFNKIVDYIFCEEDINKIVDRIYQIDEPIKGINNLSGFIFSKDIKLLYHPDERIKKFFKKYI